MKKILISVISILLFSCSNKTVEPKISYYPISIIDLVGSFKKSNNIPDSARKIIVQEHQNEIKKIDKATVLEDIESFVEFDINKAAWQKSFIRIDTKEYTRFLGIEARIPLKYIDVYGDLKNPERVTFYFLNSNNLYQSSKVLNWIPKKSYSIYSIQDVKGMEPDTIFIKTSW